MKPIPLIRTLFLLLVCFQTSGLFATEPGGTASIPFDQLGAEAQKSYKGDGISITPPVNGALLKAVMQDLAFLVEHPCPLYLPSPQP
jgi:hypothetical protein